MPKGKPRFKVVTQWRGVGDEAYDVVHRDIKRELPRLGIVGEPVRIYAVLEVEVDCVIADCYRKEAAQAVCNALNAAQS